jgi:hypothetical protein
VYFVYSSSWGRWQHHQLQASNSIHSENNWTCPRSRSRPNPVRKDHELIPLTVDSRLDPGKFDQDILYRTSFYANGWGTRALTSDEIGLSFGLPTWLRGNKLELRHLPIVPIQIMDGCLRGLFTDDFVSKEVLPTPLVRPPRPSTSSTWLPGLKKYLPHSWMESKVASTKAVKSDDAGIPIHMWDQRTLLVLPWVAPFLFFLRRHFLFLILRNLFLEFKDFMDMTHGKDWSIKL